MPTRLLFLKKWPFELLHVVSKIMLFEIIVKTFVTFTISIMLQIIVNLFYIVQADNQTFG